MGHTGLINARDNSKVYSLQSPVMYQCNFMIFIMTFIMLFFTVKLLFERLHWHFNILKWKRKLDRQDKIAFCFSASDVKDY